jgi:hypothetical protein
VNPFVTITPMVPAGPSLADGLAYFTEQLGFSVEWTHGAMAGVRRGAVELHLVENAERLWADNASFSIGVADLDALYAEYQGIAGRVGPLEMKVWGRREFHLIAPSGVCFQFYQSATP